MRLSIVVAASENDVIGVDNRLPWRLPDDLKRFKALTLGKPVIMGRKTYDSIGKPLPGRRNIVITRSADLAIEGALVVRSLDDALRAAEPDPEAMLIGGADVYRQLLPRVALIHLTRVHTRLEGGVRFPTLARHEWREISREPHPADERHAHPFTFITLERIAP